MKKEITVNGRKHTIKTREQYAPVERVVDTKKQYKRSKEKQTIKKYIEEEK
jgi:ferritin-like metal-binding protein YciE